MLPRGGQHGEQCCSVVDLLECSTHSGAEDRSGGGRGALRSRGSATSVNLRGHRNKSHPHGSASESSSEHGSLRFDQFLDAEGSDDEGKMQRQLRMSSRAKSSVSMSYSAMLAAETAEEREGRLERDRKREANAERGVSDVSSALPCCVGLACSPRRNDVEKAWQSLTAHLIRP